MSYTSRKWAQQCYPRKKFRGLKANIERLEKFRQERADGGINKLIEGWIEEQKKKLKQD
ncbi:MAG: hypothetical protein WB660_13975 [Candidatus Sulfotelmatobacter sp.]